MTWRADWSALASVVLMPEPEVRGKNCYGNWNTDVRNYTPDRTVPVIGRVYRYLNKMRPWSVEHMVDLSMAFRERGGFALRPGDTSLTYVVEYSADGSVWTDDKQADSYYFRIKGPPAGPKTPLMSTTVGFNLPAGQLQVCSPGSEMSILGLSQIYTDIDNPYLGSGITDWGLRQQELIASFYIYGPDIDPWYGTHRNASLLMGQVGSWLSKHYDPAYMDSVTGEFLSDPTTWGRGVWQSNPVCSKAGFDRYRLALAGSTDLDNDILIGNRVPITTTGDVQHCPHCDKYESHVSTPKYYKHSQKQIAGAATEAHDMFQYMKHMIPEGYMILSKTRSTGSGDALHYYDGWTEWSLCHNGGNPSYQDIGCWDTCGAILVDGNASCPQEDQVSRDLCTRCLDTKCLPYANGYHLLDIDASCAMANLFNPSVWPTGGVGPWNMQMYDPTDTGTYAYALSESASTVPLPSFSLDAANNFSLGGSSGWPFYTTSMGGSLGMSLSTLDSSRLLVPSDSGLWRVIRDTDKVLTVEVWFMPPSSFTLQETYWYPPDCIGSHVPWTPDEFHINSDVYNTLCHGKRYPITECSDSIACTATCTHNHSTCVSNCGDPDCSTDKEAYQACVDSCDTALTNCLANPYGSGQLCSSDSTCAAACNATYQSCFPYADFQACLDAPPEGADPYAVCYDLMVGCQGTLNSCLGTPTGILTTSCSDSEACLLDCANNACAFTYNHISGIGPWRPWNNPSNWQYYGGNWSEANGCCTMGADNYSCCATACSGDDDCLANCYLYGLTPAEASDCAQGCSWQSVEDPEFPGVYYGSWVGCRCGIPFSEACSFYDPETIDGTCSSVCGGTFIPSAPSGSASVLYGSYNGSDMILDNTTPDTTTTDISGTGGLSTGENWINYMTLTVDKTAECARWACTPKTCTNFPGCEADCQASYTYCVNNGGENCESNLAICQNGQGDYGVTYFEQNCADNTTCTHMGGSWTIPNIPFTIDSIKTYVQGLVSEFVSDASASLVEAIYLPDCQWGLTAGGTDFDPPNGRCYLEEQAALSSNKRVVYSSKYIRLANDMQIQVRAYLTPMVYS